MLEQDKSNGLMLGLELGARNRGWSYNYWAFCKPRTSLVSNMTSDIHVMLYLQTTCTVFSFL